MRQTGRGSGDFFAASRPRLPCSMLHVLATPAIPSYLSMSLVEDFLRSTILLTRNRINFFSEPSFSFASTRPWKLLCDDRRQAGYGATARRSCGGWSTGPKLGRCAGADYCPY